jgi:hypothetical protein
MKKLLLLLTLLSTFAHAQLMSIGATTVTNNGKTYTPIPNPLAFSNSVTVNHQTTSTDLSGGELGGKFEIKLGRTLIDYPAVILLNLANGSDYKVQSLDPTNPSTWSIVGGSGSGGNLGQSAIRPSGSSGPHDITISNVRTFDNQSCFSWGPSTTGANITLRNIVGIDHTFAGIQCNIANSGQSYTNFTAYNVRMIRPDGEGFYLGNTGSENSVYTGTTDIHDCYVEDAGREGFQFNGHANIQAEHLTVNGAGVDGAQLANQRSLIQVQNAIGYMKNCVFMNGYNFAQIAVNSFTFENCFFGATWSGATMFIGNMATNGYTVFAVPGGTVTFKNCTFYNPNFVASTLFDIRERNCNFVFEGTNTFPASATSVWADNRGADPPYTITNTGTFVFTNTPPLPILGAPPEGAYVGYEKVVVDDYHYANHMGSRTPN